MKNTRIYLFVEFFAILFLSALVLLLYQFDNYSEIQVADAAPTVSLDSSYTHSSGGIDGSMNVSSSTGDFNKTMVVAVSYRVVSGNNDGDFISDIFDNLAGTNLTKICGEHSSGYWTELWYLDADSVYGGYDLDITWVNSVDDRNVVVAFFDGADSTNPVRASSCTSGTGTTPSTTITSNSSDLVFAATAMYTGGFNGVTEGSVQMTRVEQISTANVLQTTSIRDGASSIGMSWTSTVSWPWAVAAVSLTSTFEAPDGTFTNNPQYFSDPGDSFVSYQYNVSASANSAVYVQIAYGGGSYYNEYIYDVTLGGNYYDQSLCYETMYGDTDAYNFESYLFESPTIGNNQLEISFSDYVGEISVYVVTVDNINTDQGYVYDYYCRSDYDTSVSLGFDYTYEDIFTVGGFISDGTFHSTSAGFNTTRINFQAQDGYSHTLGAISQTTSDNGIIEFNITDYLAYAGGAVMFYGIQNSGGGTGDGLGPNINLDLPTNFPYLNSDYFTLRGTVTDSDGVESVVYDDEISTDVDLPFSSGSPGDTSIEFDEEIGPYADGQRTITITAEDGFGDTSDENIVVYFDESLPQVFFETSPDEVNTINNDKIDFVGVFTDLTPIDYVQIRVEKDGVFQFVDDITSEDLDPSPQAYSFEYSLFDVENGVYYVEFSADDAAFNSGVVATFTFEVLQVDTYPECVLDPFFNPTSDQTPTISGTCTDPLGVDRIHHRVFQGIAFDPEIVPFPTNNSDPSTVTLTSGNWGDNTVSFELTSPALLDGSAAVFIKAFNTPGGVGQDELIPQLTVVVEAVDNAAPTPFLNQVVPDPLTDTTPIITGTCGDKHPYEVNTNIASIEYNLDNAGWNFLPNTAIQGDQLFNSTVEIYSYELPELSVNDSINPDYTVQIRCTDAAGNVSSVVSDTFVIEALAPGDPEVSVVTEDFTNQLRNAVSATNAVWGNGIVRLKEDISVSRVAIDTTDFKDRYDRSFGLGDYEMVQGPNNTLWYSKRNSIHSYNTVTTATQSFDATTYGMTQSIRAIAVTQWGGDTIVYAGSSNEFLILNVTQGTHSLYTSATFNPSVLGPEQIWIDPRSETGLYIQTDIVDVGSNSNLIYIQTNGTFATGDDTATWYATGGGVSINNVTSLHLDTVNNHLYIGVFNIGLVKIDDNGTPGNIADDTRALQSGSGFDGIFDIVQDQDTGDIYYVNNVGFGDGVHAITDDGATPMDLSDDTFVQIADDSLLFNKNVYRLEFIEGREYVGDQLLVISEDATILYINPNNTPEDLLDDTIIALDMSAGQNPLNLASIVTGDYDSGNYNTWYITLDRAGLFRVDVTRGWEAVNQAIAFTVPPANTAAVDNIELVSLDILDRIDGNGVSDPTSTATVETYVSIDDGLTWTPITVGEVLNLATTDYRVRFRMDLNENPGTTPVIDSFSLTYAAYEDPDDPVTVDEYEVIATPSTVGTGENFDLEINALDTAGFVVDTANNSVDLELLNSPGLSSASGLSVSDATLVSGTVTLNNVTISNAGTYVIRADDGTYQGDSNTITVTEDDEDEDDGGGDDDGGGVIFPEDPIEEGLLPSIEFTADNYTIQRGETVTLSWDTRNFETVFIDQGIGLVNSSGSVQVSPQISTLYTISGFGDNGDLSASLTIIVEDSTPADEEDPVDDGTPSVDITVPEDPIEVYPDDPIIVDPELLGPEDPQPEDDPEDNIIPTIIIDDPDDPGDDPIEIIIDIPEDDEPPVVIIPEVIPPVNEGDLPVTVLPIEFEIIELIPSGDEDRVGVEITVRRENGDEDIERVEIIIDRGPAIITVPDDVINVPRGEVVEICWRVDGNPGEVFIDYLDAEVSPVGCFEFIPTEDIVLRIIARKGSNVFTQEIVINIDESVDVSVTDSFEEFPDEDEPTIEPSAVVAPLITAIATLTIAAGVSIIYTASVAKGGIVSVIGLFAGLVFNRNKKYWGIVFDPKQSLPVPLAVVRLMDNNGKNINQSISDFEGKYGFIAGQSGTFKLEVKADGYEGFTKELTVQADQEVVEDVALQKEKTTVGALKETWKKILPVLKTGFTYFSGILMLVGFVVTVIAFSEDQSTLNIVMLVVYALLLFLNIYALLSLYTKAKGKVVDSGTKRGLAGVVVRFYQGVSKVSMSLTNEKGIVKMNLKPAEYLTIANKDGYKMKRLDKLAVNEQGYISETISLDKLEEGEAGGGSSPFGGGAAPAKPEEQK